VNARVEVGGEGALGLPLRSRKGRKPFLERPWLQAIPGPRREVIERQLLHKEGEPFNSGLLRKREAEIIQDGAVYGCSHRASR